MSEESPAPPPLPASPLEKLNDFSDKLSPMLVKELRQGLRTYSFVILFLVLQGFLALILLTTIAADTNAGEFVSSIIFSFFAIAVLVVQPLRGMTAISSEVKGKTIDLIALTKLSAWRIVWGKWTSIMGQTALLLCAIIPYLILRYFFGGMQLFAELFLLLTIFVISGALTAITVGLSATNSALIRILPLLAGMLLLIPIFGIAFDGLDQVLRFFTPETADHWLGLLGGYLVTAYIGYIFLEIATTAIAPASQNRATCKRLIALPVVLLSFGLLYQIDGDAAWMLTLILISLLTLDLFTENTEYPSIVLRPFQKFGLFGKGLARLLTPGWASGTLFYFLLFDAVFVLAILLEENLFTPYSNDLEYFGIFFGILNFNLFITNLFKKKIEHRFVPYLLISVLLCGFIPLLEILENMQVRDSIMAIFAFIPHSFFYVDDLIKFGGIWAISGLYGIINLFYAVTELRKISILENEDDFAPQSDLENQ